MPCAHPCFALLALCLLFTPRLQLITTLYEFRVELAASFRLFDTDNSGKVSPEEFKRGLEALKLPLNRPITDYQVCGRCAPCLPHAVCRSRS